MIRAILNCARWAHCGGNGQPWEFIVVARGQLTTDQNPKFEYRNPKQTPRRVNPKSEARNPKQTGRQTELKSEEISKPRNQLAGV